MKVLFVASEGVPFIKTGGLGDVVGALPKELQQQGVQVSIILPKYGGIPEHLKSSIRTLKTFAVSLHWRNQYCGIQYAQADNIDYYFIDNEFYFKRQGLYGYGDDAERFVFFSKAVLEALPHLDFVPDILHCHDWQTGLIPFFLKKAYGQHSFYQPIRTIFTVHNLKYQGRFSQEMMADLLGWPAEDMRDVWAEDDICCLQGGIAHADVVTTVSPTYAEEIQTPARGEGLDGLLSSRSDELIGIVNGIDYALYNPRSDPNLFCNYSDSLEQKRNNKTALQQELGLPQNARIPMIGIVTRLVEQKGLDLVEAELQHILQLGVQLVVLGTGEDDLERYFLMIGQRNPQQVSTHITFNDALARKIYAASDLFLMPSRFEPCGIGQLLAMRYLSVPVVRETGGLKDTVLSYNEHTGQGNGFSFTHARAEDLLYTLKRAVYHYHNDEVWRHIIDNIKQQDYSWSHSAGRYVEMYERLYSGDQV